MGAWGYFDGFKISSVGHDISPDLWNPANPDPERLYDFGNTMDLMPARWWSSLIDNAPAPYNGSDYLSFGPGLLIERPDGDVFSLNAIDLTPAIDAAYYGYTNPTSQAIITGNFASGGSITQIVDLDLTPNSEKQTGNDFTHYMLTGFSDLLSVTIFRGEGLGKLAADNIELSYITVPTTPVPEPQTYAMLLAGLELIGCFSTITKKKLLRYH